MSVAQMTRNTQISKSKPCRCPDIGALADPQQRKGRKQAVDETGNVPARSPSRATMRVHSTYMIVADRARRARRNTMPPSSAAAKRDGDQDDPDQRCGWPSSFIGRRTGAAAPANRRALRRKRVFVEIGPEGVDEQQFGIGRLPQQEIGQPHLARGADQQVELGQVAGHRARRRAGASSIASGSSSPAAACAARRAGRTGNFGARAIVERDDQGQPVVAAVCSTARSSRSTSRGRRRRDRRSAGAGRLLRASSSSSRSR